VISRPALCVDDAAHNDERLARLAVVGNNLDWADHEATLFTLGCRGNVLANGIDSKAKGVEEVNSQEDLTRAQGVLQGTAKATTRWLVTRQRCTRTLIRPAVSSLF
jgi:hypothetical protein